MAIDRVAEFASINELMLAVKAHEMKTFQKCEIGTGSSTLPATDRENFRIELCTCDAYISGNTGRAKRRLTP